MSESDLIKYRKVYDTFVPALERELGPKEDGVNHAIMGFEFGGPPDILLFRKTPGIKGTFYVTSDLLFFERQPENSLGRYEMALCVAEEGRWGQHVLYKLAQASVEETFDVGHTADIAAWVDPECGIKGLVFTRLVSFECEGQSFGTLLGVGLTRDELDFALEHGSKDILDRLQAAGVFPVTDLRRQSIL